MAASKTTAPAQSVKQIHYLAGALKAPRITEAATRLADQARDAGWSFEDYLAAVLEREVSARNASGARLRVRAAGFPATKTIEDFDFDVQPTVRNQITALTSGAFLTEACNIVLLGPPGTGKTHCETGSHRSIQDRSQGWRRWLDVTRRLIAAATAAGLALDMSVELPAPARIPHTLA